MKELQDILKAYKVLKESGARACLATLVDARGSTYRRPGAHMLMRTDGPPVGTIGGGCLDTDLLERAHQVINSNAPLLVTYDSSSPEDIIWGLSIGCGGIVRVYLEPVPRAEAIDHLDIMLQWLQDRTRGAVATLYKVEGQRTNLIGGRYVVDEDGVTTTDITDGELLKVLPGELTAARDDGRPRACSLQLHDGRAEVFVEPLRPPQSLIIFGAGADAAPLVRYAKELGWHVTLADYRAALLRRERFPDADSLVIADQEKMTDHLSFTADDAAVVMTHNFNHDFELLKTLLPSCVGYIGLLGSRTKASALLKKLRDEGCVPTDMQLRRLYAPVGLDIGAEAPEEIALAVAAEVQAVLTGHPGAPLRSKGSPFYESVAHAKRCAD